MAEREEAAPERAKPPAARKTELTFFARLLLNGAGTAHGRLVAMGASLWFIGGVLTLGAWLTRDDEGRFHLWTTFFVVGTACLVLGVLVWIWKALRKNRSPL